MNRHLSDEQMSLRMAGEIDGDTRRHLLECAACADEMAKIQSTLSQFRSSARRWSEQQEVPIPHRTFQPGKLAALNLPLRWALAAFALLALAAVPVYRDSQAREKARNAAVDAMLLQQVDAGISRTVPETMEPLVKLVSWSAE